MDTKNAPATGLSSGSNNWEKRFYDELLIRGRDMPGGGSNSVDGDSVPYTVMSSYLPAHLATVLRNQHGYMSTTIYTETTAAHALFDTVLRPSAKSIHLRLKCAVPTQSISCSDPGILLNLADFDSVQKNTFQNRVQTAVGGSTNTRQYGQECADNFGSPKIETVVHPNKQVFESTDNQFLSTTSSPNPDFHVHADASSANSLVSLFFPESNTTNQATSSSAPSSEDNSGTSGAPSASAPSAAPPSPPPPSENSLRAYIESNPLFGAGFGLMALGAVLAAGRRALTTLSSLARRALIIDLEIASKDASYDWFLEFLAKNERSIASRSLAVETSYKQHASGSISASFNLVPGLGTHLVKWGSAHVLATRERSGRLMDNSRNRPFETLKLQTLYMYRHVFSEMLEAAQKAAQSRNSGKTVLYTSLGPEWRPFGQPRRKRLLTSVVLAPGVKESLENDVNAFLHSQQWYADRGVPYRRGYLLYGPPGSGKTSVIQALAGALDYNICILNLAELTLTDDRLNHLLNNVPPRSFVLLEDVDAAFNEVRKQNDGFRSGITFSGLLNALDGVTSAESRLVFMTTNHPDRLDPALVRPGRVDFKVLLDNASPRQVRDMFYQFYNDAELADEFVNKIIERGEPVSTATLQGLFIFHKDDPRGAIEAV